MKTTDLEIILGKLSGKGMADLVYLMTQRAEEVPRSQVERAIDYYVTEGSRIAAYRLAEIVQNVGIAQSTLDRIESKNIYVAIQVAKELGLTKRAIELCVKVGKRDEAAEIARSSNQHELIIDIYAGSENRWEIAGKQALELGNLERAIEIYEAHYDFREAIKVAEKLGLTDKIGLLNLKAIEFYEKKGKLEEAGDLAEKLGLTERAKDLWKRDLEEHIKTIEEREEQDYNCSALASWYDGASRLALKLGQKRQAVKYKTRTTDKRRLADFAKEIGCLKEAMQLYEQDEYSKEQAARLAEKLGLFEKALGIYEKAGCLGEAAKVARRLGQKDKSQQLYKQAIDRAEKWGREHTHYYKKYQEITEFIQAGDLALESGDIDRAIALYRTGRNTKKALDIAKKKKKIETVVEILSSEPDNFEEAARFAERNGRNEIAERLYGEALKFYESRYKSSEASENAARVAKKLGLEEKADAHYRSAMSLAENDGEWRRAYRVAVKLGEKEKASLYRTAQNLWRGRRKPTQEETK